MARFSAPGSPRWLADSAQAGLPRDDGGRCGVWLMGVPSFQSSDMKRGTRNQRGIGLMSGTSADGVDVALVRFSGGKSRPQLELEAYAEYPIPKRLRERILSAFDPTTGSVDLLCQLNVELGELYARCALRLLESENIDPGSVDFVASHGQTVYHIPRVDRRRGWKTRSTLQLGEPSVIAERTGITTVADFRPRDMAAGGQGAPLVSLLDSLLYAKPGEGRVLQNIGGIANATFLPRDGKTLSAFDTGPGNMVIDGVVSATTGGRLRYDRDGRLAANGTVSQRLLKRLLTHPYYRKKIPKTTGREDFGAEYVATVLERAREMQIGDADLTTTVTALTVESIARAYERFLLPLGGIDRVMVSGGGAKNPVLMAQLSDRLAPRPVESPHVDAIPPEAKEAVAFALLGYFTLRGWPNNVPSVTGAERGVVMGKVVRGG